MRELIENGHLYLAVPPLYKLSQGARSVYARDDAHKDLLLKSEFNGRGKIEISRFKGLGEMMPRQLKETTMSPETRTLLRVEIADPDPGDTMRKIDQLMGNKPEARFLFIQENAEFVSSDRLDI
jgi:topoisomerase-4 subunit B